MTIMEIYKGKIWIDAGHGGTDPGAVHAASGRKESDDTLRYALELARQFAALGFTPVLTRKIDESMTINARCAIERAQGCILALSCHRNAAGASANGAETWVHSRAPQPFVDWGGDMLDRIARLGMRKRGSYKGTPQGKGYSDFGVNRLTNSASMLIELGFVTSDADNALFDAKLPELCGCIVESSVAFLKVRGKI